MKICDRCGKRADTEIIIKSSTEQYDACLICAEAVRKLLNEKIEVNAPVKKKRGRPPIKKK